MGFDRLKMRPSASASAAAAPPPRARRVLHVFTFFRPDFTGEGIYLTNLLPHLQAQGFANDVLVQNTDPQGARVVSCSAPAPHTIHYLVARQKALRHLKLSWWLLRHGRDYDLVHFHSFSDRYFLGSLVARLLGARVVQSSTCLLYTSWFGYSRPEPPGDAVALEICDEVPSSGNPGLDGR